MLISYNLEIEVLIHFQIDCIFICYKHFDYHELFKNDLNYHQAFTDACGDAFLSPDVIAWPMFRYAHIIWP